MILLYIAFVVLFIVSASWLCFTQTRFYKLGVKIPGPNPLPIIGNVQHLWGNGKLFPRNFEDLGKKYPKLFRFFLGTSCFVAVLEADDIRTVLHDNKTLSKFSPMKAVSLILGDNLLTSARSNWKKYRRISNPAFSIGVVKNTTDVLNRKSKQLIGVLGCNAGNGEEIDVYDAMLMMTLDSIIESFLGVDFKIQENNRSDFVEAFKMGKELVQNFAVSLSNWYAIFFKITKAYKAVMHILKIDVELLKTAMEQFKEHKDLHYRYRATKERIRPRRMLDNMLKFAHRNNELIEDVEFKDQCRVIVAAGSDTTAFTLSVCVMFLGLYKHVQDKVSNEMKVVFGGNMHRSVENEDLQKLVYTEQVINETMRLFPVLFLTGRSADEDVEIGGYLIPAGMNICISPYLLHRNSKYFPDPLKFDPERFSPENVRSRHPYSFLPFFAGPRNCIGQYYAMKVMKTVLCYVLRNFEIFSCGTREDMEDVDMQVLLSLRRGYKVRLEKRFWK